MEGDVYELHKSGLIDLMARETVPEDEADRQARQMEPDAYALTYEEGRTTMWAYNIFDAVIVLNGFIETDATTGLRVRVINPDSTEKIIEAFDARGLDPDALYNLADRILSGNWFTLLLSANYQPDDVRGLGFSLVSYVDGKRDEGILKIEDYPAIYEPGISRTELRESLGLPENTKFLYSSEWDVLEILRTVCNPQQVIEEKIGFLSPYSMMPNAAAFTLTSRFINNPKMRAKDTGSTIENILQRIDEDKREYQVEISTRNCTTTLTVQNYTAFLFDEDDPQKGKRNRRGNLGGVKKVWRFALQKLMQQSVNRLIPEYITIDLEEMISNGMFTNVDNAYRAIEAMVKKMTLLHIRQDFPAAKGSRKTQGGVLFYHCDRTGARARIFVNRQFGFEFFRNAYTYFPASWAYQLDGNAFSLTEYVFSLLRMNSEKVTETGKFEIKLTTLHNQLGLRSVEDVRENANRRYNDFIKKPILQAVDEVNAAAKKDKEINGRFRISIKAPETTSIEEWLSGSVVIYANGEYTNHLTEIAETRRIYSTTKKEKKPDGKRRRRGRKKKE